MADAIDEGDRIVHCLEKPLTVQSVAGEIDWPRRYDHMQQHTGQRWRSALFQRVEFLDEAQRTRAQAYAENAKAAVLLLAPDSVLVACSEDSGLNAGVILKRTLAMFGGSGGGSALMAQGGSRPA